MTDVVRTLTIRGKTEGVDQLVASLGKVDAAQQGVAASGARMGQATEAVARRQLSAASDLDRVKKSLDEAYRSQERFNTASRKIDRASNQGLVDEQERARLLGLAAQKYGVAQQANENNARPPGLAAHQIGNLRSQIFDVATSLQGGVSPFTVLSQQGPQIYEALAGSKGIGAGLKDAGASALSLASHFTPLVAGVSGLAAAAATGAAAWYAYDTRQKAVEASLAGIGRQSGTTRQEINDIARAVSRSGDVSIASARELASSFAATGRIGPDLYEKLTTSARDYARVTGQDLPDAAADFAKAFADPVKGAEMLQARLGSLGDATVQAIRRQQEAGDRIGAQRTLLAALNPELADAEKYTTAFGRAWERLKAAVSNDFDDLGHVIDRVAKGGSTLQEQLEHAQSVLQNSQSRQQGLFGTLLPGVAQSDVDQARGRVKQLQDEIAAGAQRASQAQAKARGDEIAGIVRGASPDLSFLDDLDGKIANLRRTGDEAARRTMDPKVVGESQAALERLEGARKSYLTTEQAARASDDLAVRSIQARTVAQLGQIAAEEKLLALSRQSISETERARQAEAARTLVLEQLKRASEDALKAANDTARSAGLLPYQRGQAEIANRLRDDLEKATGSPDAMRLARQKAEADRRTLETEQVANPLRDSRMRLDEQLAGMRVQRDSFLLGAQAAGEMAARQDMINTYARQGIDIMAKNADAVNAYAKKAGEAAAANENLQRTTQNVIGGMDELRSSTTSSITGIFSDLRQGKNPLQNLVSSMGRMADQFFERTIAKPLTEKLFGFAGKAGGGLFGDSTSKAFGDVSSVKVPDAFSQAALSTGSMTVTAASVVVNGAAASAGSLLPGADPASSGVSLPNGGTAPIGKVDVAPLQSALPTGAGRVGSAAQVAPQAPITQASLPSSATPLPEVVVPRDTTQQAFSMPRAIVSNDNVPTQAQMPLLSMLPSKNSDLNTLSMDVRARDADRFGGWSGNAPDKETIDRMGTAMTVKAEEMAKAGQSAAESLSKVSDAGSSAAGSLGKIGESLGQGVKIPDRLPGVGGSGINLGGGSGGGGGGWDFDATSAETWNAFGNVMTSHGPLPLSRYAAGGVATSPQVAIFGEGRMNEAYVPLPDGRSIPVSMRVPMMPGRTETASGGTVIHSSPTYNIPPTAGGVTPDDVVRAIQEHDRRINRTIGDRMHGWDKRLRA